MKYSKKKLKSHLEAAKIYSKLSYAEKRKVAALLINEDRIISLGYNGTPSGSDNTCEYRNEDGKLVTYDYVLHAEENAIAFAAKHGISTDGCIMVITHSPCSKCARLIIQSGIKQVWYGQYTDHPDAFVLLTNNKVFVGKV